MDINKPRTLLVSSYIDTGANSFREQHAAAMASRLYYSDGAAKNGFTYDKHGLTVSGVARESSEMIKDTLKSIKKGRVWDKEKLKKSWVTAQLKHYGLLSTGGTNDALRSRLEAAANEGKCDTVPEAVQEIEKTLQAKWVPILEAYESEVKKRELAEQNRQDQEFSKLTSPETEAMYSPDRFIRKYFQNADGEIDRTQSPKIMKLSGMSSSKASELLSAAELVTGLHTEVRAQGPGGRAAMIWIGWDKKYITYALNVFDKAKRQEILAEEERKDSAIWARHEAVKRSSKERVKFGIADIGGNYMVRCAEIESQWDGGPLELDIENNSSNGANYIEAGFDFRVLEGMLRLSLNESFISDPDSDEGGNTEQEDLGLPKSSDDHEEQEGEQEEEDIPAAKRKAPAIDSRGSAKKQKTAPTKTNRQSRRVYFKWRGRETGEGEIQLNYDNENIGWLDFDLTLASFEGETYIPFVSGMCNLKGYKMHDEPGNPDVGSWSDYGEREHEYARVNRWR